MIRHTRVVLAAVFVMSLALAGCDGGDEKTSSSGGSGGGSAAAAGGATPKEAVENFRSAMITGDAQAVADCYDITSEQKQAMVKAAGLLHRMSQMNEKLVEAYGEGMGDPLDVFKAEDYMDKVEATVDGEKAEVKSPNGELDMVQKDGVWLFVMSESDYEDVSQMAQKADSMIQAMDAVEPLIGQEGYDLEKIQKTLQAKQQEYSAQ